MMPTSGHGFGWLLDDVFRLDPESSIGVRPSGGRIIMDLRSLHQHGEFARFALNQIPGVTWMLSVRRNDVDAGARKVFVWPAGEAPDRIATFAETQLRAILASPVFPFAASVRVHPGGRPTSVRRIQNQKLDLVGDVVAQIRSALEAEVGVE